MKNIAKHLKCLLLAIVILVLGMESPTKAQWVSADPPKQDNTATYIIIGVAGALVVTAAIILIVKLNKKHKGIASSGTVLPFQHDLSGISTVFYNGNIMKPLQHRLLLEEIANTKSPEIIFSGCKGKIQKVTTPHISLPQIRGLKIIKGDYYPLLLSTYSINYRNWQ